MATVTHVPVEVYLRSSYEPEIRSLEDTLQRLKPKLEDYRKMGIAEIWVIDPQDKTFYRYQDSQLQRKDFFSHDAKGIEFDRNELRNLLD